MSEPFRPMLRLLKARARVLRHAKLRVRLSLSLIAVFALGAGLGVYAHSGVASLSTVFAAGMLLAIPMLVVAQHWVAAPIEALARTAREAARLRTHTALAALPTHRPDETGALARCVQTLALGSLRSERDAAQLRRTLAQRVEEATRRATTKLEQLAYRDSLTGLGNRRFLHSELDDKYNLALTTHTRLLCIALDVDNFKQVNDQLGHAAGDELLQSLADLIKSGFREDDITARQGGDEFVIILAGAPRQRAFQATEALRDRFRQLTRTRYARRLKRFPDLSIGVAELDHLNVRTGHQLLEAADEQLYKAKQRGKGMTVGLTVGHVA